MSQRYEKLKTLLKELFQLDQPDLDFGLYRVLHAKSAEVSRFLDKDLLPQVRAAFRQYKTADKAELEKELSKMTTDIKAAGLNPDDSPKIKELRDQLKNEAVDIAALESEVYDHLFSLLSPLLLRGLEQLARLDNGSDERGQRRGRADHPALRARRAAQGLRSEPQA